jgi:RHS repeat-associated protein
LTDFTYDTTGRLVRQTVADSSVTGSSNKLLFGFEYSYDLNNNITQLVTKTTDKTVKNKFTFGKDNLPATFTLSTGKKVDYTYDGLNRLTKTSLTTSADKPIDTTYTYFASKRGSDYTTTKLKSETINGEKYEYKYDARSNITDVTKDGVLQYHYGYDMMNQLVSVDDKLNGKVYKYTYDAGGNLISETVTDSNGTTSNAYEYNNSNWGDVLTSYNGQNITYDEIGNPLTYRDGMSMTWKNGRQLATLTNGDTSISYGYDSDSVRTTKTVNGVKYTYAYLNGQLMYETRGDAKFYYSYDANGILYNVRYTLTDGDTEYSYYYTHNSRGDIVGIYNGAGELKAHYEYDAWGNVISITDNNGNAITNPNHIGNLNPFRYRGYYQDTETGLYYLMSRYYDPITHRFINADGYFQSGTSILDANTFAYCGNNPVLNVDPLGTCKVPNYTSAGTYIGHTWKIKESVPGVPGFCNVCKGYGSNAPSNTSHSFVISSYTTPSTKKQDYNTWNKVADSFGAIFCSLEVDADFGVGFGVNVTDVFSIEAVGKHALLNVHFDEQGFSFSETDSVEVSAGVCGWDLFGVQDTKYYEIGSDNEYENYGSSHKLGFSIGGYFGFGGSVGFGWNLDYIYNRFCEIWG